ncbi:MAG: carboxypeptidase-like regulatory domain-containing protein [Bacteroidota bacterium]
MANRKWSKKIHWGTLTLFLMVSIFAHGQEDILNSPISIRFDNVSVKEALDQIARKIGYAINYTASFEKREINKSHRNQKLENVLRDIWGASEIRFEVRGKSIYMLPKKSISSSAQKGTITGRVTDNFSKPIPFASVFLQNTTYGSETDRNGNFSITAPPGDYILVVSMLGYRDGSKKIRISENAQLNISITITSSD